MSGQQDSQIMERPSIPSSGLAAIAAHHTETQSSGTPARLSFKEKLKQGLDKRMSLAMEGLSREDDWDLEHQDELKNEPLVGSRSLPLRGGEVNSSEQSHKVETPQMSDEETDSDYHSGDQDKLDGSLSLLPLGKNEHIILTPLIPTVRDIYHQQLKKNGQLITTFVENSDGASPHLLNKIEELIAELKLIGDHQDLLLGPIDSQRNISNDTVFKWAITCSPKCLFLEKLFNSLRSRNMNIAILARPGMTLDILTSMLEAQKISYVRPDAGKEAYFDGELRATLLPTGFAGGQFVVGFVDAVIAFDSTFFAGEVYTNILRSHPVDPNLVSPLIALATDQSAEHIELCLPKSMDPKERKACLCSFASQKGQRVGLYTKPRPEEAAPLVAEFLVKYSTEAELGDIPEWPLSQDLGVYDLDIPSGYLQQSESSTQPLSSIYSTGSQRAINKRAREVVDDENAKRMRMTPIEDQSSSGEVSRGTDSAFGAGGSAAIQTQPDSQRYWTYAQVIADRAERDAKHQEETAGLFATISDLQAKLQAKNDSEARIVELQAEARRKDELDKAIRQALSDVEQDLAGHVALVEKFQPAYQQLSLERNQAANQLIECEQRAAALSRRLEARSTELNDAKLTINKTQEELKAAKDQLLHSTVPGIRELEEMKQKLQAAEEEKNKAEKSYQSLNNTYEYTKEEYQRVSQHATNYNHELGQLKKEYEELERKAGDNKVKILQIQAQSNEHELCRRIDELKEEVASLNAQLEKKSEELNKRGGRSLRGVSGGAQSPMLGSYGAYGI